MRCHQIASSAVNAIPKDEITNHIQSLRHFTIPYCAVSMSTWTSVARLAKVGDVAMDLFTVAMLRLLSFLGGLMKGLFLLSPTKNPLSSFDISFCSLPSSPPSFQPSSSPNIVPHPPPQTCLPFSQGSSQGRGPVLVHGLPVPECQGLSGVQLGAGGGPGPALQSGAAQLRVHGAGAGTGQGLLCRAQRHRDGVEAQGEHVGRS